MSTPFLSEIRVFSFNYPPKNWAFCNGQLLAINQNQALFSLLGTTYGGNGQTTFALPNLQGRTPIHFGDGHTLGEQAGEQAHTLSINELPQHTHQLRASSQPGTVVVPTGNILASSLNQTYRAPDQALTTLIPGSIANVGGSQAHDNMQPYLTLNFCICLAGIFPSRN